MEGLIREWPLVLASGSPRRRRILDALGLDFSVDPPDIHETAVEGEGPGEHVERLAVLKARSAADRRDRATIVAADTAVLLEGTLLGKPGGPSEAERMLRSMSGRWHEVLTGVAVMRCSDAALARGVERTRVLFRDLAESEIRDYVAGGEPLDKAGAYGVQECGAALVSRIEGCFYNVMGLPVVRLRGLLVELDGRGGTGPQGA
jgi:septum formation protein